MPARAIPASPTLTRNRTIPSVARRARSLIPDHPRSQIPDPSSGIISATASRYDLCGRRMSHETTQRTTAGAEVHQDGTHFRVWAPRPGRVRLILESPGQTREINLERDADGCCFAAVSDVGHGQRYWYELDGRRFPD